jgi:hypothetical protein
VAKCKVRTRRTGGSITKDTKMDNVRKAIDLASIVKAPVEHIVFEVVRSTQNGAYLYSVQNCNNETRYVIEGETGEMLDPMECTEEEAIEEFNK